MIPVTGLLREPARLALVPGRPLKQSPSGVRHRSVVSQRHLAGGRTGWKPVPRRQPGPPLCYRLLGMTASLAIVTGGCGVPPTLGSSTSAFVEDAEPAIAALDYVPDEILVQAFPGTDAESLSAAYAAAGAQVVGSIAELDVVVLRVAPEQLASAAAALDSETLFDTIQKNYLFEAQAVPDDTFFSRQDYLDTIRMNTAWDVTTGDEGTVIAVVDTGVDADHEDLADKILDGWNVYDDTPDYSDVVGHGTQVAGIAGASSDNGTGITGIAWDSLILPVRVVGADGRSSSRHIASGILWAVNHDADVINVSFAPLWSNRIVKAAAQTAFLRGKLVVISAGNGGGITSSRGYPEALFVGAMGTTGSLASFSDKGPFVDFVAPGTEVRATLVGNSYGLANGTSFAAPIIAGVAALSWSANPELRPVSIVEMLTDHAVDLGIDGKDSTYGHGLVDAAGTVDAASKASVSLDETPPTISTSAIADGDRITRRAIITVSSTDHSGVADVTMSVDGVGVAVDTRSPYRIVIDPNRYSAGAHQVSFVSTDVVGNRSETLSFQVEFGEVTSSTTAAIEFTTPPSGASVSGSVTVEAAVSTGTGLALVEWLVDGVSVFSAPVSGTESTVSYRWRSDDFEPGDHTISLVVTDAVGRRTTGNLPLTSR